MYDMIFELTDKRLDASEVPNVLKQFGINYLDYNTKIDEHNRMIFFDKKKETEEKIDVSSSVIESKSDVVSNHDEINTNDNPTNSHIENLKKLRDEVISEYYVSESYENNDVITKNK